MQRNSGRTAVLGLAVAAAHALACGSAPPPAPPPEPTTTLAAPAPTTLATLAPAPSTLAASSLPPSPLPTSTPSRRPPAATPRPSSAPATLAAAPAIDHARVARLVAEGEAALGQGRLAEAEALFDQSLALDASDAAARRGKARTATTRLGLTRTLVPDISSAEGAEGRVKTMEGFDDVEDLNVKRAARVPGRAELDTARGHLKPGDSYTVSIYLRNQSKKKKRVIQLANVSVHRIVDGKDSVVEVAWSKVEVQPKQRVLVATLTAPWEDSVSSWILQVRLLSESGDIYENRLVWK